MEPIDPTEPNEPFLPLQPGLVLGEQAKKYLNTAGRWASFLGILGFIATGFIVLGAIFAGTMLAGLAKIESMGNPYGGTTVSTVSTLAAMSGYISVIYLLVAIFYFFFSFYLYKFGSDIKSGTRFNSQVQVTGALKNLKSFFKLWGITTIVIIVLYFLAFIGIIVFIASMHNAMR